MLLSNYDMENPLYYDYLSMFIDSIDKSKIKNKDSVFLQVFLDMKSSKYLQGLIMKQECLEKFYENIFRLGCFKKVFINFSKVFTYDNIDLILIIAMLKHLNVAYENGQYNLTQAYDKHITLEVKHMILSDTIKSGDFLNNTDGPIYKNVDILPIVESLAASKRHILVANRRVVDRN